MFVSIPTDFRARFEDTKTGKTYIRIVTTARYDGPNLDPATIPQSVRFSTPISGPHTFSLTTIHLIPEGSDDDAMEAACRLMTALENELHINRSTCVFFQVIIGYELACMDYLLPMEEKTMLTECFGVKDVDGFNCWMRPDCIRQEGYGICIAGDAEPDSQLLRDIAKTFGFENVIHSEYTAMTELQDAQHLALFCMAH